MAGGQCYGLKKVIMALLCGFSQGDSRFATLGVSYALML